MTRSPIRALLITVLAPIEQSRPIRTSGADHRICSNDRSAADFNRGPITAPGSMATPSSMPRAGIDMRAGEIARLGQ